MREIFVELILKFTKNTLEIQKKVFSYFFIVLYATGLTTFIDYARKTRVKKCKLPRDKMSS